MSPRVFLVTGAASGIGRALAEAIAGRGERVLASDRELAPLQSLAGRWPDHVAIASLDVTQASEWDAAVAQASARWGRVDVLVNMAGYLRPAWAHEVSRDDVERHFDVNCKGVVLGMRAVLPAMIARGGGHVVNVASLAALAPIPGLGLYSASKYAVRAYSLAAAQELARHGVAVTVVCPDAVRTPMLELQREFEQAAMTFSGRVLEPAEVVAAILDDALRHRPLELYLPRSRGWLARAADLFPRAAWVVAPVLQRRGRARQRGRS